MKTAIQELIEWLNDYPTNVPTIHKSAVISKAESMLEKEKEHFICYSLGYLEVHQFVHPDEFYNTFINFEDDNINANEK
jgi:hypothetical protein